MPKGKQRKRGLEDMAIDAVPGRQEKEAVQRAGAMRSQQARERAKAAKAAEARTYTVKSGDSLSKIAQEVLGDANGWKEIFEANKDKIKDPNLIYPGQELVVPGASPAADRSKTSVGGRGVAGEVE